MRVSLLDIDGHQFRRFRHRTQEKIKGKLTFFFHSNTDSSNSSFDVQDGHHGNAGIRIIKDPTTDDSASGGRLPARTPTR
jgi:hypothetical protein